MRALIVVVLAELLGDLAHLLQGRRTLHRQAFCLIAAMIALDEPVLLGMVEDSGDRRYGPPRPGSDRSAPRPKENRCRSDC
jgi:hypothetical protein